MERPWLILRRVLDVGLPGLHAVAEEHAVVIQAEADANAQAQQHAGVGEAEEHVAAVDAAAQAQHAAVAEAEADAQAQEQHAEVAQAQQAAEDAQAQEQQHAGVGEGEEHDVAAEGAAVEAQAQDDAVAQAEEDAQAQEEQHAALAVAQAEAAIEAIEAQIELEESVVDVNTNMMESQAAHAMMVAAGGGPDFTITVARPPRVSSLFAGLRSHPDQERPDMYPYIIATGPFCLLVHFAIAPSYGTNFDQQPALLVVVRHFLRTWNDDGAQITACAEHIPGRLFDVNLPALRNIESIGLVCDQGTAHYEIAELVVTTGAPHAAIVYFRSDTGLWGWNHCVNPILPSDRLRHWVPHGTVTINTTVLWYDLSWGIITCDLAHPQLLQVLNFHRLPPGRVLLRVGPGALSDLHCRRCIAVSENLVRYVEIILSPDDDHEAATVNMWYRDVEDNPWRWETNYSERFGDIWDHESYAQTELPRNIPMLVGVSPVNSSVVYFSLNQRLFGVNVPEHTVVDCEQYEPLNRPGPPDEPVTSRYLITWNLDADGEPNVGHRPDEASDHADSSASGPADEGELDCEALLE